YNDVVKAFVTEQAETETAIYFKDIDGNWYKDGVKLDDEGKAQAQRDIALNGDGWSAYTPEPDEMIGARADKISANGIELGAYKLTVTPGPFTLVVAGNEKVLQTKDRFGFIQSTEKPEDPKFQLTTDIAGVGLTAEYETDDNDNFYAFAKVPVAGIGEFGAAFGVKSIGNEDERQTDLSADIASDALGFATLKAGFAYRVSGVEDGNDALAFAIGAEAPVIEGLVVDASYKNEGRNRASDDHTQTISAGAKYNEDMVTASVSYQTRGEDDKAKLTLKAGVKYPVIADVLTVNASIERISDEDEAIGDPDDYEWDGIDVGDILHGLLTFDASADYVVSDAFTITPSIKYQSFTFEGDDEGAITTFGVKGTYKFSSAASVTLGLEKASGDAIENLLPEVDSTKVTTAFTVSF
ncbi:MAG: porin, partial [Limnochorda sp.]|uniref:hypothetical protein n=1 Tax=Limnochorda sp. TaxID=1940279 RepID=UPI0039C09457